MSCEHPASERITRTAHGYLGDAARGTVQTLCGGCGAEIDADPASPVDYNHVFKTFLGIPPDKSDVPLCGADLPESWDFAALDRPPCPTCSALKDAEQP